MHLFYIFFLFGINALIGFALIKAIKFIKLVDTPHKSIITKAVFSGLFFTPTLIVLPAGDAAGIYAIPANIKLLISIVAGKFQSALLLGTLPIVIVTITTYIILFKSKAEK